jgi:hypothetical protein
MDGNDYAMRIGITKRGMKAASFFLLRAIVAGHCCGPLLRTMVADSCCGREEAVCKFLRYRARKACGARESTGLVLFSPLHSNK